MSDIQIHRIFIDAPREKVWEAITSPQFSRLYGYAGEVDYDLSPGGAFEHRAGEDIRLVQTWAPVWIENEEPGTVTWEIEESAEGSTRLTLTHDVTGRPTTAEQVAGNPDASAEGGGGWPWVLSGIKTLLETGTPMEESAA